MLAAHAAMIAVDSHPSPLSQPLTTSFPMISLFVVINIITIMIGTTTMPLMTALQ